MIRTLLVVISVLGFAKDATGQPWFPVDVVADGQVGQYQPLLKADKRWRICALLPHGKDNYWWGVAWGLAQEAERLNITLGIYEAGGYQHLEKQREQLHHCRSLKADAFIVAAISANGLEQDLQQLAKEGVPVVDLVNGIDSDYVSARSLVSFADMAATTAVYVVNRQHNSDSALKIGWLPGPAEAKWVQDAEFGLQSALQGKPIQLQHGGYGATESFVQANLVQNFFRFNNKDVDVVIANAVAAELAVKYLRKYRADNKTPVVAFYSNAEVLRLLKDGELLAAATDSPVIQSRIAVDLAVRILQKQPYAKVVSPQIEMLDQSNLTQFDLGRILPPEEQWIIRRSLDDFEHLEESKQ